MSQLHNVLGTGKWSYGEDRTYHGFNDDGSSDPNDRFRLVVELSEFGPTEREYPYQLRHLKGSFGWGYNGSGTSETAEAILRDALDLPARAQLLQEMQSAFCEDVVAHFAEEFMIRRGAVLRWARGWAAQHGVTNLPKALINLPPVSRYDYADRPEEIATEQDRARTAGQRRKRHR